MSDKSKTTEAKDKTKRSNFFDDFPAEEFKKMKPQIDKYNKNSDQLSNDDSAELNGEQLVELSKKLLEKK